MFHDQDSRNNVTANHTSQMSILLMAAEQGCNVIFCT
jgi:hypothetical protein